MPNYGDTHITVTGPEQDRKALHDALVATAYGTLAFSIVRMAADVWRSDGLLRDTEIDQTDDTLMLFIRMDYDYDCLALANSLSHRHPALHFAAYFTCEGTWPEFTAAAYANGIEIYYALFETSFIASIISNANEPNTYTAIAFYMRTPERALAATSEVKDRLDVFLKRPVAVGSWLRSDDCPSCTVYLLPNADEAGHLVLAPNLLEATAILLRDVDGQGGYREAETMSIDRVRERMPELAGELDRLELATASDRAEWAAKKHLFPADEDALEIPF